MTTTLPDSLRCLAPPGELVTSALALAYHTLEPAIFNHSFRVYLLAKWLANREDAISGSENAAATLASPNELPLLFVASICHDLGASDLYNGRQRFEVEGADAASAHLLTHGASEADAHRVWTAIALHTSPGIAERIDPFTRLVRIAVGLDFSSEKRKRFEAEAYCAEIEQELPRLDVEKVLGDAVVKQAGKLEGVVVDKMTWLNWEKFPAASWPGILLRAHLENPGHEGVNHAF